MDESTIKPHAQTSAHFAPGFTAKAFDFATAFGRKVVPLVAGCALAWLISPIAPIIGTLCLTAGALWAGYLIIKPLCFYVIKNFYLDSEIVKNHLERHLGLCLNEFSNKIEKYSSDDLNLSELTEKTFPKMNHNQMEPEKIFSQFENDIWRSMKFKACLPNDASFHINTGGGVFHFDKKECGNCVAQMNFIAPKLNAKSKKPQSCQKYEDNKHELANTCRDAFYELSVKNKQLATAAMDLTTQTTGNALFIFLSQLYERSMSIQTTVNFTDKQPFTELEARDDGSIIAKLTLSTSGCKICTHSGKKNYQIHQRVVVSTSVHLDPNKLDMRKFNDISVSFGEITSINFC